MSVESNRIEGGPFSQFAGMIRQIGYNQDVNIETATITAPPPNLRIKIDGMTKELEADDVIVSEHLTKHTRHIKITNNGGTTLSSSNISGMEPKGNPTTPLSIDNMTLASGNLTVTDATIEYLDELKVGDRVIVASRVTNVGHDYFILDRAVTY